MKHELDDDTPLVNPIDGTPYTEDQRYGFFVGLAEHYATEYQRQRKQEYPPIEDYLDGVVKGDQAQIDAYIAKCQAIKAKYPKPTT
jgi:hypothetical protein